MTRNYYDLNFKDLNVSVSVNRMASYYRELNFKYFKCFSIC